MMHLQNSIYELLMYTNQFGELLQLQHTAEEPYSLHPS